MRQATNILLGILFAICMYLLIMQGFAVPSLSGFADLLLRFAAALSLQLLLLRTARKYWLRVLPLALTSLLAVWGFFLFLTSPSWQSASLLGFLCDYAAPAVGCLAGIGIYSKH